MIIPKMYGISTEEFFKKNVYLNCIIIKISCSIQLYTKKSATFYHKYHDLSHLYGKKETPGIIPTHFLFLKSKSFKKVAIFRDR